MKYLFVDTNNFVSCALLTEPRHDLETIEKLRDLLNSNKITLLLPEVVEIEFFRVVDTELSKVNKSVDKFIDVIKKEFPDYLKNDKQEYIGSAENILKKRASASDAAKRKIRNLFDGKNIIKIPITDEILINAYKRALAGKKPYRYERCSECNELKNIISNDCLIFESLLSKIEKLGNMQLIFCSANCKDFAEFNKTSNRHVLHPDLKSELPKGINSIYYPHLADVLKDEFKEAIKPVEFESLKRIAEYLESPLKSIEESMQRIAAEYLIEQLEQSKFKGLIADELEKMQKNLHDDLLAKMAGIIPTIVSLKKKKE